MDIGRYLRQQQFIATVRQLVFVGVLLQLNEVSLQQALRQFTRCATVFKTKVDQEFPVNR